MCCKTVKFHNLACTPLKSKKLFQSRSQRICQTRHDIKKLVVESNSTPLTMPHTKFEVIPLKDVGEDRLQAKIHVTCVAANFVL